MQVLSSLVFIFCWSNGRVWERGKVLPSFLLVPSSLPFYPLPLAFPLLSPLPPLFLVSFPDPIQTKRVWSHSADSSGFIKNSHFIEKCCVIVLKYIVKVIRCCYNIMFLQCDWSLEISCNKSISVNEAYGICRIYISRLPGSGHEATLPSSHPPLSTRLSILSPHPTYPYPLSPFPLPTSLNVWHW